MPERGTGSPAPASAPVRVWLTTVDRSNLLTEQAGGAFARPTGSVPTVTVDESRRFQKMDGFGASLTDSSAWLLYNRMTPAQRTAAMARLFDPVEGIGLSYLRQPVGASDFALQNYTYDDMPPGQSDPEMAGFSIRHDVPYVLPALREALALNPGLKIMASPWSAPAWMKSSGSLIGGTLNPAAYDAYVEYLRRFVQAYAAQGLPIDALTLQNEPDFLPSGYPGMQLTAAQEAALIRKLGPALASADLPTKLVGYDGNWGDTSYPLALLGDAGANAYLDGTAFHCYSGVPTAQSEVRTAHPTKGIYLTECSGGAWSTDFAANLWWDVHTLVIGAARNWAKTVVKWNLALDENHGPTNGGCQDCRGVMTVDSVTGEVTYNVEYYSLGHASKFVQPGAHRIESTTFGAGDLETVAFRNPNGTKALVALNGADRSRSFRVSWKGRSFAYALPAGAVATFTW